jgi:hypothetical protein
MPLCRVSIFIDMLSIVLQSVVMPNVVAPSHLLHLSLAQSRSFSDGLAPSSLTLFPSTLSLLAAAHKHTLSLSLSLSLVYSSLSPISMANTAECSSTNLKAVP